MRARAAVLLAALAACSTDASERIVVGDQGFSVGALDGWTLARRGEDAVLTAESGGSQTIAVRTGRRKPGLDRNDPSSIIAATERVLAAMPRVKLGPGLAVRAGALEGRRYDLRFVPPGRDREYQRTHVVLVGERHFWHLVHTAPADAAMDARAFDSIVASFAEEG
jgi:hypothetical protein